MRKLNFFVVSLVIWVMGTSLQAQSGVPTVTPSAEYNIGASCPMAQTLDPSGTMLWVLMQSCRGRDYRLEVLNVADGSLIQMESNFADELTALENSFINPTANAMAFLDDTTLSIYYNDMETFEVRSLTIALAGQGSTHMLTDEALNELLYTVTDFPDTTVYNTDHTQAAVTGRIALTIFDLTTGTQVLSLPLEPETYNAYPSFSKDGNVLYVTQLDNYEDVSSWDSTLYAYDLPDGTLRDSDAVPAFDAFVSPDGKYAAVIRGSNDGTASDLFVLDLVTGGMSDAFAQYEAPRETSTCTNDGRTLSGISFPVSGRLSITGLNWLPDSSAFVFTRSYGNQVTGVRILCTLDYSRLNRYDIGG